MLSLEKDILVVGEAARGDEVAKLVERTKPDVLLLDLKMPKGDIVQTLLEVKDINPTTKVLVLTAFSEDENIFNAAKGGARGYVLKGIDFTTLLRAIKTSCTSVRRFALCRPRSMCCPWDRALHPSTWTILRRRTSRSGPTTLLPVSL